MKYLLNIMTDTQYDYIKFMKHFNPHRLHPLASNPLTSSVCMEDICMFSIETQICFPKPNPKVPHSSSFSLPCSKCC